MFWRGRERRKVRLWQGAKPGILQTGVYQNSLRGLFSDCLRSSRELEASVTLTPSPGASPRIVFVPWGCLGTAGAAARSTTDSSKPCWESSLDSRSSSPISLSFLALPFLLLLLFFPRCSEEGESKSAVLLKGPWLTVWVRKTGIRTGPPTGCSQCDSFSSQVNYQHKKTRAASRNLLRLIKESISAFDQSSRYDADSAFKSCHLNKRASDGYIKRYRSS